MARKDCENCARWFPQPEGLTGIGNEGICGYASQSIPSGHSGPALYAVKKVPFWMRRMIRLTYSFEGTNCSVHKQKPKKVSK